MGVLIRKERGIRIVTGIARLAIVGFIVALASSLIDTVWAVYMNSFLDNISLVGFLSAGLTVLALISYFIFIPYIEKNKKTRAYILSLIMMAATFILFAINADFYIFIILAVAYTVLTCLRITSFGIIVKDRCSEKQLPRNEGLMYTILNVAWVIGPLIAGYVSDEFGISKIFILAAILFLMSALVFKFSKIKDSHIKKRTDRNMIKNFLEFFEDRGRVQAYIMGASVGLWWILIYLFVPIYILENHMDTLWVGYFLFAVAVPLIIFEFPFSKFSSKIGFKRVFRIGFLILTLISLACFFITNVYVILGMLVLASMGMALLEPTTESYFFEVTEDSEESRYYGPYNTTLETSHLLGKLSVSILLIFAAFKYAFLLYAFFMLLFWIITFKIKDVLPQRRKKRV
ncbi:MAG TPA: MFS transporter [Patescibacteria group bacterium]|nr:MFS transporter [Patescibacteria group bacterium]